jgi:hypothetical protein
VNEGSVTTLLPGDVIFRDKTTDTVLDGPKTIEEVMAKLVEQKLGTMELSVVRGNKVESAFMQLALEAEATADSE